MPTNKLKFMVLSLPRFIKKAIVVFNDLLICLISVWLSFGIRLDQWNLFSTNKWIVFFAVTAFSIPIFISFGLYRTIFRYIGSAAFTTMVNAFILYFILFFIVFTLIGVDDVPRSIGALQPILLFFGVGVSRYFMRHWIGNAHHAGLKKIQINLLFLSMGLDLLDANF